jgi:hypothetical protein
MPYVVRFLYVFFEPFVANILGTSAKSVLPLILKLKNRPSCPA